MSDCDLLCPDTNKKKSLHVTTEARLYRCARKDRTGENDGEQTEHGAQHVSITPFTCENSSNSFEACSQNSLMLNTDKAFFSGRF